MSDNYQLWAIFFFKDRNSNDGRSTRDSDGGGNRRTSPPPSSAELSGRFGGGPGEAGSRVGIAQGAPKASDDYEDRVKMIITAELAKEKVTN